MEDNFNEKFKKFLTYLIVYACQIVLLLVPIALIVRIIQWIIK